MSSNQGIFEPFNSPQAQAPGSGAPNRNSPFSIVEEQPSPFASLPQQAARQSPFTTFPEEPRPVTIPDRRSPQASPFHIAEPQGFGFEANQPQNQIPFPTPASPLFAPAQPQANSPFSIEHTLASQPTTAAWPQPLPQQHHTIPPSPLVAAAPQAPYDGSRTQEIKQLALRAIFGVDHEMSKEEIIQRARSLPGIRQIALVNQADASAIEALNRILSNLGLGSGPIKLYSGSVPIDFIREGGALLAVQTDGGFAPGVREALMLIARELGQS